MGTHVAYKETLTIEEINRHAAHYMKHYEQLNGEEVITKLKDMSNKEKVTYLNVMAGGTEYKLRGSRALKDKQMLKLFERISENEATSGIQQKTADWVLDLYSKYEDTLVENAELKEQIDYQADYIEENTVDPHAAKIGSYYDERF